MTQPCPVKAFNEMFRGAPYQASGAARERRSAEQRRAAANCGAGKQLIGCGRLVLSAHRHPSYSTTVRRGEEGVTSRGSVTVNQSERGPGRFSTPLDSARNRAGFKSRRVATHLLRVPPPLPLPSNPSLLCRL